jgi:cation:H+ antiporter
MSGVMLVSLILIAVGVALLTLAGDRLIDFAAAIARRARVTPAVIGLTIVAAGTSTPELFVSITAALKGSSEIAIANAVGSNAANIGLILGLCALVAPLPVLRGVLRFEYPVMVLVSWLLILFAHDGRIDRLEGGTFLAAMVAFVAYAVWVARRQARDQDRRAIAGEVDRESGWLEGRPLLLLLSGLVACFVGLGLGAQLLVSGARDIALRLGLTERLVGLTIVAIGTSLPELVASLAATLKRQQEMAVTNIIGSNVFNVLMILGASALLRPIPVSSSLIVPDMAVMMTLTLLLFPLVVRDQLLERWEGALLLGVYVAYLGVLILG